MFLVMGNAGAGAGAGAATAAAAIAQAIKASGVILRVEPEALEAVLQKQEAPLVVHSFGGFLMKKHRYLSSYKGLAFYTQSALPLDLPRRSELVEARAFWMPS